MALISLESHCQDFTAKSWSYSSITVRFENLTDSVNLFTKNSSNNRFAIGDKNNLVFYRDNTYTYTINDSVKVGGKWSYHNNDKLIMDKDTSEIIKRTATSLGFKSKYNYLDGSDRFKRGFLYVHFSLLAEDIQSIKNGNWNDWQTWSTNRVPNRGDKVTIKQGHKVTLPVTETGYCKTLLVESGAVFDCKTDKSLIIDPKSD